MTASKFLVSTVAAAAVVGAIGIAYAQTTTPPAYTAPTTPATTTPAAPMTTTPSAPMTTTTTPAPMTTTTTPAPTDTSTPMSEPAVRADRN